jgi:hypothetical protein
MPYRVSRAVYTWNSAFPEFQYGFVRKEASSAAKAADDLSVTIHKTIRQQVQKMMGFVFMLSSFGDEKAALPVYHPQSAF